MKRFLSVVLALVMLASLPINVCAANATDESEGQVVINELSNDGITPRFTYLSVVSASIDKGALGFVTCASTYSCVHTGLIITLTCVLQRTDGSSTGWVTYKTAGDSFSGGAGHGIEKTWFAPAGYAYRTYTTVLVYSSGTLVEKATCYSSTLYK